MQSGVTVLELCLKYAKNTFWVTITVHKYFNIRTVMLNNIGLNITYFSQKSSSIIAIWSSSDLYITALQSGKKASELLRNGLFATKNSTKCTTEKSKVVTDSVTCSKCAVEITNYKRSTADISVGLLRPKIIIPLPRQLWINSRTNIGKYLEG